MSRLPLHVTIRGHDLPGLTCGPSPQRPDGHHNIHVGVQRKARPDELLDLQPGNAATVEWSFDATIASDSDDVQGRYVQGRPGDRFVYLSWGELRDGRFEMFRRAKLYFTDAAPGVLDAARRSGRLTVELGLTDAKGNPTCSRPPDLRWSPD